MRLRRIEALVLPAEIQLLRVGKGYIAIDGFDRASVHIPNIKRKQLVPAFIRRPVQTPAKAETEPEIPISKWPEYRIVDGIINRCTNPNSKDWKHYGGRGITVYPPWLDRKVFTRDLIKEIGRRADQPMPFPTVDRINNDLPYQPGNIRWATMKKQLENRRDSNGELFPAMEME